jgi:hypothetical protein
MTTAIMTVFKGISVGYKGVLGTGWLFDYLTFSIVSPFFIILCLDRMVCIFS